MKCPYCGSELEQGFIQSSHGIFWTKQKKKLMMWPNQRGDIHLNDGLDWNGVSQTAYHCGNCKKIIISLDGKMK